MSTMADKITGPGMRLQRIVLLLLLSEFLLFVVSGVSFSFLHGAVFFDNGIDIFFGIFYASSLPQWMVSHQWLGILADVLIIVCLLLLVKDPRRNGIALALFFLLFLYYVTLMGYLNHRNFHIGFVVVLFPFLFAAVTARRLAYEFTRYYLLFFYASAALFKIIYHSFEHTGHLSGSILQQYAPYFIEGNTGVRTSFHLYLINHPQVGFILLIGSFAAELLALAGFFTRRLDRYIGISLLLFHLANWFIMDLAPFGQLAFISLLFMQHAFPENKRG